jgi:DNA mismatch repair protein PMS2
MAANPARPSAAGAIRPISKDSIHRICSGQVVLDLAGAVKELVENALDAGATNIEIRLKDHGAESIEVVDNGTGVSPENHEALTQKYATSKIHAFDDLLSLSSFGFRGEALSSLCALSDLTVTTRTESEDVAARLTYDRRGGIVSRETVARAVGTTVSLRGIFEPLPVRHKEFTRNLKREYGKLLTLLQAYALVSSGVRIICSNQSGGKHAARATVIHTQGNGSVRQNVATVFGAKTVQAMVPVDAELEGGVGCRLVGFVSKAASGCGRGAGDRQFFFVNGRPVDLPRFAKTVNELYRAFCPGQCPMAVLDFKMPTDAYDVNVTPDKRKVMLHDEDALLRAARAAIETVYEPSRYTYAVGEGATTTTTDAGAGVKGEPSDAAARVALAEGPSPMETEGNDVGNDGTTRGGGGDATGGDASARSPPFSGRVKREPMDFADFGMGSGGSAAPRRGLGTQTALGGFGFTREKTAVALGGGWRTRETRETRETRDGEEDGEVEDDGDGDEAPGRREPRRAPSPRPARGRATNAADDDGDEDYVPPGGVSSADANAGVAEDEEEDEEAALEEDRRRRRAKRARESTTTATATFAANDGDGDARANGEPDAEAGGDGDGDGDGDGWVKEEPEEATDAPPSRAAAAPRVSSYRGAPIPFVASELGDVRAAKRRRRDERRRRRRVQIGAEAGAGATARETNGASAFAAASVAEALVADVVPDDDDDAVPGSRDGARHSRDGDGGVSSSANEPRGDDSDPDPLGPALREGDAAASRELERVFRKDDFSRMRVVGQFNLGFILAALGDDLFIVDQHASDEIHNFERLQRVTTLNRQPLIAPARLDLTAAEEQTVRRHMDTFLANGFGFCEVAERPPADVGACGGCCIALQSVPFSKGTTFGVGDVQELIGMLDGGEYALPARSQPSVGGGAAGGGVSVSGEVTRPSRVRAMLAMRACRSSIMIGRALDRRRMRGVLDNLAKLRAPWNCPHGRPTMRHLADLRQLRRRLAGNDAAAAAAAAAGGKNRAGGW